MSTNFSAHIASQSYSFGPSGWGPGPFILGAHNSVRLLRSLLVMGLRPITQCLFPVPSGPVSYSAARYNNSLVAPAQRILGSYFQLSFQIYFGCSILSAGAPHPFSMGPAGPYVVAFSCCCAATQCRRVLFLVGAPHPHFLYDEALRTGFQSPIISNYNSCYWCCAPITTLLFLGAAHLNITLRKALLRVLRTLLCKAICTAHTAVSAAAQHKHSFQLLTVSIAQGCCAALLAMHISTSIAQNYITLRHTHCPKLKAIILPPSLFSPRLEKQNTSLFYRITHTTNLYFEATHHISITSHFTAVQSSFSNKITGISRYHNTILKVYKASLFYRTQFYLSSQILETDNTCNT